MSRNRLTGLPTRLGELTSLTTLRLHDNRFTSLPDDLGGLTGLNQLTTLRHRPSATPRG